MCSRPFRPVGLPIYVARLPRLHSLVATLATLPSISEISFFDCSFAIISSKIGCRMDSVQFARVLVWLNHFVIATELVTTRAMPDRDVFYVAHPIRSIVSSAAPAALDRYLAALPAMSLIPFAPFFGNTVT